RSIPFISTLSLHAICPFGGVVSLYNYIMAGAFIQKIHQSSFVLMIITLTAAILLGPVICGWVCPFGTFQEFIGKIGRKIFGRKYNLFIPAKLDKYMRFLRYIVLVLVVYITATEAKLLFQNVDPYYALFNFWSSEVSIKALLILGAVTVFSLFVERPWCKYLCPYGALLGITNLFRIFKVRRIPGTCINCKMCDRACPMNIKVSDARAVIDHQCITCLKCTSESACPVPETVIVSLKEGKDK
ncbi:MAG: 4Fe-4S binding protein, partial [Eubacteriales bacterium]|nr:4Fe-4S binding protein [Eubacteriales bacterium]